MGLTFLLIHFLAIFSVLKMSVKRNANIHLWGALTSCWGLFVIPYFLLVTSVKQSKKPLLKQIQNSTILFFAHCGASIGILMGLANLFANVTSDKSDGFLGALLFYVPTFIFGLPWSLVSIFTGGIKFKLAIVVASSVLNGALIGIAYGAIGNNKTVRELAMNSRST